MFTALVALSLFALLLLVLYVYGRGRRRPPGVAQVSPVPERLDTTVGEFQALRQALRPLEHTRTASRRDPDTSS